MLGKIVQDVGQAVRAPRKAYDHLFKWEPIYQFTGKKLTYDDLVGFGEEFSQSDKALIVSDEIDCSQIFDEYTVLPDHYMEYDQYLEELTAVPDEEYEQVVAFGVLEHLSDPVELLNQCHRVLTPGGRLYVSASFAFSVHNGPQNYFHVTPHGMELLLRNQEWSAVDIRGSCDPFKTIGILLQRILLQTRSNPLLRPFVALLAYTIPYLDRFIHVQYDHVRQTSESEIDSMLPSNVYVIARK